MNADFFKYDMAVSTLNRPIEFLFSILKCKYLRLIPIRNRTLKNVKSIINLINSFLIILNINKS